MPQESGALAMLRRVHELQAQSTTPLAQERDRQLDRIERSLEEIVDLLRERRREETIRVYSATDMERILGGSHGDRARLRGQ